MTLEAVKKEIRKAEKEAGRIGNSVSLIAVSKIQPKSRIEKVLNQGHRVFGENRVQEAYTKWPQWREKFGSLSLHLVGPLQTNKVKQAMELFEFIHSLDREKLARVVADNIQKLGFAPKFFVQVNTGEEKQKAGVLPAKVDDFIKICRLTYDVPITGLMCIPPVNEEPALHFALLKKFSDRNGLKNLSMGMSSDFQSAIALGATHVRIGSAIFGERINKPIS